MAQKRHFSFLKIHKTAKDYTPVRVLTAHDLIRG